MKKFWSDEGGAVATEYAIIVTVIALVIVVGAGLFGDALNSWFKKAAESFEKVNFPPIQ